MVETGTFWITDWPRSKLAICFRKDRYCTTSGRSKPSVWRMASMSAWVAVSGTSR